MPQPIQFPTRPRLALVLGSGGVRSIAAVGIAKVLAREGIYPDMVVGCSSGALFGATVASGMDADTAVQAAMSLWSPELTQQKRWLALLQLALPKLAKFSADFSFRDASLIGQRIDAAFGHAQLQELVIPLRVAATDAASGERVVLSRGSLAQALRASMAVPFLFPPVAMDGRSLVDGVISDPLPIDAAADAHCVITLGFQGGMPAVVNRPSRLVARVSTALINNLMHARVDAARARGQHIIDIHPVIEKRIGLWDTAAMPYLFETGCRAAELALPQIVAALQGPSARAA
jgi:NTE family protein